MVSSLTFSLRPDSQTDQSHHTDIMKLIGLVVLLQVGTVLSLPFIGSSNSESSTVDYITSCFSAASSSGDYNELQKDVAAGLWLYEKGDVNSAKKTLKEYPTF
ncbi:hypothetical protein Pmani_007386 [Petrolisthes manimaculis]|uniref:Uncharacterized protein n=1 Tax=Petrolisthes manimaculis TaxID=1843537 RepID=A0AAE1QAL9_9EUCA|nr:hypothetical protein Pmani_007386 [Petrolisthes manimaculis]